MQEWESREWTSHSHSNRTGRDPVRADHGREKDGDLIKISDDNAMAQMENEGGGTRQVIAQGRETTLGPDRSDRSPLIAVFRSKEEADRALRALRQSGVANERIAVASGNTSVQSPANDAGIYRATGKAPDGGEFRDAPLQDSFRARVADKVRSSPNLAGYKPLAEALEYQHPSLAVMVSVAVGPGDREKLRDLLLHAGAAS